MPGPEEKWREPLVEAVRAGRVDEEAIDAKVRRLLLLAARAGALDGAASGSPTPRPAPIEDAAPLARTAAAAAAVLLHNDGLLPLQADGLRRVAVLGPGARDARPMGGGSASVPPAYVATPVAGLRNALAGRAEVVTAVGAALSDVLRSPRPDELAGEDGTVDVTFRWLDAQGSVLREQTAGTATIIRLLSDAPDGAEELEIRAGFTPDEDGDWRVGVVGRGDCTLALDGRAVLAATHPGRPLDGQEGFGGPPPRDPTAPLRARQR